MILSTKNGNPATSVARIVAPQVDSAELKRRAAGRWEEILQAVAGIPADLLDGKNHACPRCGGTDRFRMIDGAAGAVYCNKCLNQKNGDGLAAIQWHVGCDFQTAVKMLADYLRASPSHNGHVNGMARRPAGNATLTDSLQSIPAADHSALLETYCKAKPPITPEGIRQCRGELVTWHGFRCVAFSGRVTINSGAATAVVLVRAEGTEFPGFGKLGARKSHSIKGSTNSWLCSATAAEIEQATTILDLEGLTDLLAVSDKLPATWVAVANTAGALARGKLPREWGAGKKIIVLGDCDGPGVDGQRRSAAAYIQAGVADVLLGKLPFPIEENHGRDLRDYLNAGQAISDLPTEPFSTEQAAPKPSRGAKHGPAHGREVEIGMDESRVINDAIAALAPLENVYQRAGNLVQVVVGADAPRGISRPPDAPRIALLKHPTLRELLADAASWYRPEGTAGRERIHPPDWLVKAVDARGQWQAIRRLEAVIESPALRADGSILQVAGYDETTGLLFRPDAKFPHVPDRPTRSDAIKAVQSLLEVVEDFPFATEAHRSAWIAATLTPVARHAFNGCAPLFLIDANVRGSGKTLLTDAIAVIVSGRAMARTSFPKDDDEFRKRITALAVAGEPLILIDNISGTLQSASFAAALTATSWSDRILGQSTMVTGIPLNACWYGSGNNVILDSDIARRTLHVRLESRLEKPEERSGFRHADLLAWIRQERPRLTAAALTILSGYCAAGRPSMNLAPWGSFEPWSDLIRNAITWIGLADPGTTRAELTSQSDHESGALRQLLSGWREVDPNNTGRTVLDVIGMLSENPRDYDTIRGALFELCPPKDGKSLNPRSVAMRLNHLRRRVCNGYFLDKRNGTGGKNIWTVKNSTPESSCTSGSSCTNPSPPAGAGACAHAHRKPTLAGNSATTATSATACQHPEIEETPTFDGYINRQCRSCGTWLPCQGVPTA